MPSSLGRRCVPPQAWHEAVLHMLVAETCVAGGKDHVAAQRKLQSSRKGQALACSHHRQQAAFEPLQRAVDELQEGIQHGRLPHHGLGLLQVSTRAEVLSLGAHEHRAHLGIRLFESVHRRLDRLEGGPAQRIGFVGPRELDHAYAALAPNGDMGGRNLLVNGTIGHGWGLRSGKTPRRRHQ
ncbi:ABC transporter related protein [Alicycliphilus sp. B1]|nr:ABC transporter related protein [Alicycliphilus sp. B1]